MQYAKKDTLQEEWWRSMREAQLLQKNGLFPQVPLEVNKLVLQKRIFRQRDGIALLCLEQTKLVPCVERHATAGMRGYQRIRAVNHGNARHTLAH